MQELKKENLDCASGQSILSLTLFLSTSYKYNLIELVSEEHKHFKFLLLSEDSSQIWDTI